MSAHVIIHTELLSDLLRLHECDVKIVGMIYDAATQTVRMELTGPGLENLPDPEGQVSLSYQYEPPRLQSGRRLMIANTAGA